jgi:hypothetical protein
LKNNKKKQINEAIKIIIIVCLTISISITVLGFFILKDIYNHWGTKDVMQYQRIYKAAMEGVTGFRLAGVRINNENNSVVFILKLKDYRTSSFTEEELEKIYKATCQLREYLNENERARSLHNEYLLRFEPNRPGLFNCYVKCIEGEAVFYRIFSSLQNRITSFHMMKDVRAIHMLYGFSSTLDTEKVEKISKFENLEEIYFYESVDEESLTVFAKIINKNNPQCKIFVGGEEFVLPD